MNVTTGKYDAFDLCSECNGGIILIKKEGETICKHCGLVIHKKEISFSPF